MGAGIFMRPVGGCLGSIIGYNFGKSILNGEKPAPSIGKAFAELDLGRDGAQLVGSTLGGIFGQALIPVPVVGGFIGATLANAVLMRSAEKWIPKRTLGELFSGEKPAATDREAQPRAGAPSGRIARRSGGAPSGDDPGFQRLEYSSTPK